MRFVDGGPDIPESLLRAHLAGEVVFVVGAGLSQNASLPDFKTLVDKVYRKLNLDFPPNAMDHAAERDACSLLQWDRVLGMLEARVGDLTPLRPHHPSRVRDAVTEILAQDNGDLSAHVNVLRLASDRFGRPRVVTTNFDNLFECAWPIVSSYSCLSVAGPGLPSVTARNFAGILHLHGRLAHDGSPATDLVLTSSDFGEAYLRSGWAARFVYDLLRRFTVVFIGYSADDPPMRYMLEAAFSGRFQFPDIKRAYAIAECKPGGDGEQRQKWRAKGLVPLVFENPGDFGPLYQTLAAWAECHMNPLGWSETAISGLVKCSHKDASSADREKVGLLVRVFSDTATLAQNAVACDWLECLAPAIDPNIRRRRNDIWFQDRMETADAVTWVLGRDRWVRNEVAQDLRWLIRNRPPKEPFGSFWRLFLRATDEPNNWLETDWQFGADDGEKVLLAAESLRPRMVLEAPFRLDDLKDPPTRLSDLCRITFRCRDPHASIELHGDWPGVPALRSRLLFALDRVLDEACNDLMDAGLLDKRGRSSFNDPDLCHDADSLDEQFHGVDSYRKGWKRSPPDQHNVAFAPVARLLTWLWGKVAEENPARARLIACDWMNREAMMFRRMAFWCALARDEGPADQAMQLLAEIEPENFRLYRNAEFARFWCVRWNSLPEDTRLRIENCILAWATSVAGGAEDEKIRQGIYDWHLLLETGRIVTQCGALSDAMAAKRAESSLRVPDFPDRVGICEMLYNTSFSLLGLSGDLAEVEGVPADHLIETVDRLEKDGFDQENLWEIVCRNQPGQAWEALRARGDWPARRWRQFLGAYDISTEMPSSSQVLSGLLDMPPTILLEPDWKPGVTIVRSAEEPDNETDIEPGYAMAM